MIVKIYELGEIADKDLTFAVIFAKYKEKNIYVRHKERDTYEIPGGHREINETIEECAKRELNEETGASVFSMAPLFVYSVEKNEIIDYGQVFFANIKELSTQLEHEIEEVIFLDNEPEDYTYPLIQPILFEELKQRIRNEE